MRRAAVARNTKETTIRASLNLDGKGKTLVKTGIPFLDHMLTLLGTHGVFDLTVHAKGDLDVDLHHTNEDLGLVLGQAFDEALGARRGIARFGVSYVPMEEALARVVLDFSGRPKIVVRHARGSKVAKHPTGSRSAYQWGDAEHFLESFARTSKTTIHVDIFAGGDFHHTCEAVFKALGRALEQATRLNRRVKGVPSSKGRL
ncbi:MAG: imidazoleglycerol-phosphate dehydratase [Candidatus Omnitrophica bacterium]|nr:imidazoleglycerol-phosphate dehydratase [Candidatus Omnitrophota bacterium]